MVRAHPGAQTFSLIIEGGSLFSCRQKLFVNFLPPKMNVPWQKKVLSIQAGLEPTIFCSVGRRVIHCATGPVHLGTRQAWTHSSLCLWLLFHSKVPLFWISFRSVVVITCASHAQGPRFEPGRKQIWNLCFCLTILTHIPAEATCAFACASVHTQHVTLPSIRIYCITSCSSNSVGSLV